MKCRSKLFQGFTILELMITLAIVGILAAIAIPSYVNYTRRAYFMEIVNASLPYKKGVEECYQKRSTLTGCDGGVHNIPANIMTPTGHVESLLVKNGVITVTPLTENGILTSDTYVLTPMLVNKGLSWTSSGGAVKHGYAQ